MNNISIGVNTVFNPLGELKPLYVELEDDNHELHTYKIERVFSQKQENYSGISSILFECLINKTTIIKLKYFITSHKWVLIKD